MEYIYKVHAKQDAILLARPLFVSFTKALLVTQLLFYYLFVLL